MDVAEPELGAEAGAGRRRYHVVVLAGVLVQLV